ncbi:MAG: redoxin domain-containing protein [Cyclobacteriaceae bacterium]|nr:redoxin domain-containing protein [Cyclobacteriaceae bacterium]
MKDFKQFIPCLLLVFLIQAGCNPSSENNDAKDKDTTAITVVAAEKDGAVFTANPQPVPEQPVPTLEIGSKAPDFNLPGVDGKYHSLNEYSVADVLVIIFSCNHCPTAQAYEDRMIALSNDYKDKGVQVVVISPNSPLSLLYDELGYSDLGDTYDEMIIRARDKNYNFPYLYDGDTHTASMKYGPVATPHAYVFDKERILRYLGRLDASEKPGSANAEDLRAAIDAMLEGREVKNAQTKTFGCSVKWAWKDEWKKKIYADWDATPVTIEEIDEAGIAELLSNDTENLRLINVWATWCGPCLIEYPEFIEMQRMYGQRSFEFISISADNPDAKDKALKALQKKHSAVKNYIFSKEDKYALIEAVDPDWNGALPYTVLIEPGGNRIYSKQSTIDPLELRRLIVDHELIGRYY